MNIAIRVDSSELMGIGHLMRCITLAEKLRQKQFSVLFICRPNKGNLNNLILDKGFKLIELSKSITKTTNVDNYSKWLGVTEEQDAQETLKAISHEKIDWIIIDHYSLSLKWEKIIRESVKKIFVIDDLADRKHDCDIILDQNWFSNYKLRYNNYVDKKCNKLLGPKFLLLREEFSNYKNARVNKNKVKNKVFIFFGGSDPPNITGKVLKALCDKELKYLEVDVILGENNIHRENIEQIIKKRPKTNIFIQVNNIAEIMNNADLAIASGGVNTWERMCVGLFSAVITTAENQIPTIKDLSKKNYIHYLGHKNNVSENSIINYVLQYFRDDYKNNKKFIDVDGNGVNRVINELITL